jgi:hypothetical protein
MTVKVCLGLLVSNCDLVIVLNVDRIGQHNVVAQGLLEFRSHEIITRTGSVENGKVNLEPEEVEQERHDDQTKSPSGKVLGKFLQADGTTRSVNVKEVPEVNNNGRANGNEGKYTNVLDRDIARQSKSGKDEPLPPLSGERLMSELVPLDVEEETAGHGEDQSSI